MAEILESYRLPLDTTAFLKDKILPKCAIEDSIAGQIRLLLLTSFDECSFDPEFGCEIWEHEFEHSQISKIWIDRMSLQMTTLLQKYEQRLMNIVIKAQITEKEFKSDNTNQSTVRLQKCLTINLNANLTSTNEPFYFKDSIFISPFSTD
ncbi:GPW/gp25 family protein [Cryomorpha ignava]|uniref:GPW/gp25 family protein n=1 Tax=Cryomorpha ignava TaxID=101383 RepID=A0A7K3WRU4_9FLAO|nr:GPW/gp25 family protein [Cryomorpha ignava]NEN23572.1 GPW/gp25 family protein [Cryomorpha ignava]